MQLQQLDDPDVVVLQIDYQVATPDPGRVFRSMAGLIDAFHSLDRDLARAVTVAVEPSILLERIEAGSIRTFLRSVLLKADDDALKNLDWRPLIGQYLVMAKHRLLAWLDGRTGIRTRSEIVELQAELRELAPQTVPDRLLPPAAVPVERLLADIGSIARSVAELRQDDRATFASAYQTTAIDTRLRLTSEEIELLLTQETLISESELLLLVKKPDYLGQSRWEFRHGDHLIEARILDEEWLDGFRQGRVVLRPGDALRAVVRAELARGFEGHTVAVRCEVLKVQRVVSGSGGEQGPLFG